MGRHSLLLVARIGKSWEKVCSILGLQQWILRAGEHSSQVRKLKVNDASRQTTLFNVELKKGVSIFIEQKLGKIDCQLV